MSTPNNNVAAEWPEAALGTAIALLHAGADQHITMIDVGGHRGESLASFSKNIRQSFTYYGMEPNPDVYAELKKVAASVESGTHRVHCLNYAVGPTDGTVKFNKTNASAVGGVLAPVKGLAERVPSGDHLIQTQFEVEMISIDTLCKKHAIRSVDILKIDTEGYDLEVLKGASAQIASFIPKIIITEVFFVPYREGQAYFWDIASFLSAKGYHFVNLYDTRNTSQGRLYTGNGLWVSPEIASKNSFL